MIYYLRDSNSGLIGLEYNGTTYYYEKNAQDDVTKILDGEFNVVAKYEYDAWGNVISIKDNNGNNITDEAHIGNINPFRYRSYYYDQEIGMYYLNSRYYNPLWGRFITADGEINADESIIGNNLYTYCGNNPITFSDEFGSNAVGAMAGGMISPGVGLIVAVVSAAIFFSVAVAQKQKRNKRKKIIHMQYIHYIMKKKNVLIMLEEQIILIDVLMSIQIVKIEVIL